jgi:hypothetical protein
MTSKGDVMLRPVMNDTKWNELRLEMYALTPPPTWKTLSTNRYYYGPERDWFYHFSEGRYEDIVHVDIHVERPISVNLSYRHSGEFTCPARKRPKVFVCSAIFRMAKAPTTFEYCAPGRVDR